MVVADGYIHGNKYRLCSIENRGRIVGCPRLISFRTKYVPTRSCGLKNILWRLLFQGRGHRLRRPWRPVLSGEELRRIFPTPGCREPHHHHAPPRYSAVVTAENSYLPLAPYCLVPNNIHTHPDLWPTRSSFPTLLFPVMHMIVCAGTRAHFGESVALRTILFRVSPCLTS